MAPTELNVSTYGDCPLQIGPTVPLFGTRWEEINLMSIKAHGSAAPQDSPSFSERTWEPVRICML